MAYHGYPRTTAGMDIWVAMESRNAESVTEALKEFGMNVPALHSRLFLK